MSNATNHNDDLFRQKMEDYREMPSDKVWAGIQNALDNDKKKRRAIIWWWTGGLGIAASMIIAIFTFVSLNKTEHLSTKNDFQQSDETYVDTIGRIPATKINSIADKNRLIHEINTNPVQKNNHPYIDVDVNKIDKSSIISSAENKYITHQSSNQKLSDVIKSDRNTFDNSADLAIQQVAENIDAQRNKYTIDHSVSIKVVSREPLRQAEIKLLNYPEKKHDTIARVTGCIAAPPRFSPTIGIYGYVGGVAYHRKVSNTNNSPQNNSGNQKRFGLYAATAIKVGLVHRNGIYMNLGIGYESQRFGNREQFLVSGNATNSPSTPTENELVNTSFGSVSLPTTAQDGLSSNPQLLDGKLVYQNHQLFVPIDIGYRYSHGRYSVNIAGVAAFHIPISQKAVFYPDQSGSRPVTVNQSSPLNFSVGLEPVFEYHVGRYMSLIVGGTFQYYVLNAYKNTADISRPYVLSGQLGVKFYLPKFFIPKRK